MASAHAQLLAARQAVSLLENAAPGIPSGWRVAVIAAATALWRIPAPQDMGETPARRWDDAAPANFDAYSAKGERRGAAALEQVALREGPRLPSGRPIRASATNEKARCTECSGLSGFW